MKKTTIHDIARELNTTAATVSRALNDHPRISKNTKKMVLDMAIKLGYEHNSLAAALRRGRSNIIGVIVPFADRFFFSTVIRGIEEVVKTEGYNVMICQSHDKVEDEIANVDSLLTAQVSGIVVSIARGQSTMDHLQKVISKGVPLILFDRTTDLLDTYSVVIDDFQGAYAATEHLIKMGYRKIAAFLGDQSLSIYKERYRGYIAALEDHGLNKNNSWICEVNSDLEAGKEAAARLFASFKRPEALFSSSDYAALGALQFLKQKGIQVPDEFGLIGFANEPFTQYLDPPLSTVDQKGRKMGETVARIFLEEVREHKKLAQKLLLKPELKIRKSTSRVAVEI